MSRLSKWKKKLTKEWTFIKKQFSLSRIFRDSSVMWLVATILFGFEILVNIAVIYRVPYTEIDWRAYMQEVEGVLNGTLDYAQLKGDTGPLVYPAGFVYIFAIFYFFTDQGHNILSAQYLFAVLYLLNIILVFKMYIRSKKIPPYGLIFMCCTSYRIHSIYILRLFNDPVAVFFFYVAVYFFLDQRWTTGCFFFSLAVSVKMNILLFAPGLWFLLVAAGGWKGAIKHVLFCGLIQIILGLPFLLVNPVAYIQGSFDLSRVFMYEWTVNWRFLSEEFFLLRSFHVLLFVMHLAVLAAFFPHWMRCLEISSIFSASPSSGMFGANQILFVLFTSNMVGMAFSRSLHYQFYVWYFHSLPFLLWCIPLPSVTRLFVLGILELTWNTYPSTVWSSLLLQVCHIMIIAGLWWKPLLCSSFQSSTSSKTK